MFLFVCNEGPYLLNETRWAISSLARHEPDTPIHLVLFESEGAYDSRVRRWHPKIEIEHFKPEQPVDTSKPGYFFNYKTLAFENALRSTSRDIIFLDGDIIARGPLSSMFDEMSDADISIRYRPSLNLLGPMGSAGAARFNSGVIAIRNNARTVAFASRVRELVTEHMANEGEPQVSGAAITTIDQEAIWIAWEEMREHLSLHPLNDRFNDSYFLPQSALWHAKGNARGHRMYAAAIDELRYGQLGRMYHWRAFSKQRKQTNRVRRLRERFRTGSFELGETLSEKAKHCVSSGQLLSFSSDFLLANVDVMRTAQTVKCIDWDPAAFHYNCAEMDRLSVSHEFCFCPEAVDTSSADLVLTDRDELRSNRPTIVKELPVQRRFQDLSALLKMDRDKVGPGSELGFESFNFP